MTAHHYYALSCDADGCGETYDIAEVRADATRADAAQHGWVHVVAARLGRQGPARSVDYCPAHASLIGDAQPMFPRVS